jgi:hypothetical protein
MRPFGTGLFSISISLHFDDVALALLLAKLIFKANSVFFETPNDQFLCENLNFVVVRALSQFKYLNFA